MWYVLHCLMTCVNIWKTAKCSEPTMSRGQKMSQRISGWRSPLWQSLDIIPLPEAQVSQGCGNWPSFTGFLYQHTCPFPTTDLQRLWFSPFQWNNVLQNQTANGVWASNVFYWDTLGRYLFSHSWSEGAGNIFSVSIPFVLSFSICSASVFKNVSNYPECSPLHIVK